MDSNFQFRARRAGVLTDLYRRRPSKVFAFPPKRPVSCARDRWFESVSLHVSARFGNYLILAGRRPTPAPEKPGAHLVRNRLAAGGRRIRTSGPPVLGKGNQRGKEDRRRMTSQAEYGCRSLSEARSRPVIPYPPFPSSLFGNRLGRVARGL